MKPQANCRSHFHGYAGLHGCTPNLAEVYDSAADAVESLSQIHDLGRNRRRELARDLTLELNLKRDGNEYVEIVECWDTQCAAEDTDEPPELRELRLDLAPAASHRGHP